MVRRVSEVLFARTKVVAMRIDHSHQLSGCKFLIGYFLARDFGVAISVLHSLAGKLFSPQTNPELEVRTGTTLFKISKPVLPALTDTHWRMVGCTFSPLGAMARRPKSTTTATRTIPDCAATPEQVALKFGFSAGDPVSTVLLEKEKRQPSTVPSLGVEPAGPVSA